MQFNEPDSAARANATLECGLLIGRLNILLKQGGTIQTIAIHCTKLKLHRDACEFVGNELVVMRRR